MRRIRRPRARYDSAPVTHRLFTFAAAVSFALCLASLAMWAISYRACDVLEHYGDGRVIALVTTRGQVGFFHDATYPIHYSNRLNHTRQIPISLAVLFRQTKWEGLGFSLRYRGSDNARLLVFPTWSLAALFGMLPLAWFTRVRRARQLSFRQQMNLCPACGYDLRATPARCPECGAAAAAAALNAGNGSARIRTENQGIMSPLL